ncbi:MAG: hypothetical protein A3E61_00915 [Candidatus Colwellbacteria bacterium RIFCSPHIGHO2_12_FULL_43_12]|uniref:Uncharacterized protein n=3 Tax=Candidatus Colwelliibacteriota TaxID=1817904 RepID=A0A1G1Z211_9BACT|nr:MAG: hypothetical protein A3D47_00740 [Candidatus Colwellbacteria bacterium RIFCSPHIGHO2_02_FULL_43_15]OGY58822.1 MAG: hypothetical protein A3E61_00915 [Candidatus Colwellbacteria bacterium RIFCSPHIGHO2_12_FULL_43_12]OGY60558.1 MAG: hypothetical protein A3F99_00455 [Candidatus Colwellbacteria bacterium RIFCSPLOWO2_12_FULL_43_11]
MKRLNIFYLPLFLVIAVVLFSWIWIRFMSVVNEQQRVIDSLLQTQTCNCDCKPKVVNPAPKPIYKPKPVIPTPIQSAPNGPIPGVAEPVPKSTPSYDQPSTYIQQAPSGATYDQQSQTYGGIQSAPN